jgi:hypothetical protein
MKDYYPVKEYSLILKMHSQTLDVIRGKASYYAQEPLVIIEDLLSLNP